LNGMAELATPALPAIALTKAGGPVAR